MNSHLLPNKKAAKKPRLEAIYQELLHSRNTLRALFDSLPISIYIIDKTYNLIAINISRATRVGEKPSTLVGSKCFEKLFNRNSPCPGCMILETLTNGQHTNRLFREWINSEKFLEWDISTFPILDEQGQPIQGIIVEQDITEKIYLETHLIQAEKLAAVGQLAASVAHEINNPLTAIVANAQLLRRDIKTDDKDLIESVRLIEMAGIRASQVLQNLLGIARKDKYEFLPVDLNDSLRNSLALVQHELVGRPIHITLNLQNDMPSIIASQDQLQGVWINLLLNAIDAIDKPDGEITISSFYTNHHFEISIKDNGKGIAEEHLDRVFDPFFTTKLAGRGTGLGLSVCMRVVKLHGGTLTVESQQGEWTQFVAKLPGRY